MIGNLYLPEGRFSTVKKKPLYIDFACASANFAPGNLQSMQEAIIEIASQLKLHIRGRGWVLEFDSDIVMHTDFLALLKARKLLDPEYLVED